MGGGLEGTFAGFERPIAGCNRGRRSAPNNQLILANSVVSDPNRQQRQVAARVVDERTAADWVAMPLPGASAKVSFANGPPPVAQGFMPRRAGVFAYFI